jgi:hypothetical protein
VHEVIETIAEKMWCRPGQRQIAGQDAVEADGLLEQRGEPDGQDAGSTASAEEPAAAVKPELTDEDALELR